MAKQILHGEDSRQAILRGVNTLADAVKVDRKSTRLNSSHGAVLRNYVSSFDFAQDRLKTTFWI